MHLKRWLTSLVLIPVLVLILLKGGIHLFALFAALVCFLSLREYYPIVFKGNTSPSARIVSGWGYAAGPAIVLCVHFFPLPWLILLFSLALILPGWFCMRNFQADAGIPSLLAFHALGMVYICLALADLVLIRRADSGVQWICLILCVVFSGDIAAYYVGSYWGRHKLCPAVSPGKTVEGALGGVAANLGVGFVIAGLLIPTLAPGKGAVFFISVGVAGQVGDLFESMLKRSAGVKDSGNLLPGHGGMLDRIDALLFAVPVALAVMRFLRY
jgi:phosphatidate cytidylyltransferase